MQQTLVVVDMQVFDTRSDYCADRVVELTRRFREAGDPIVILEYNGSGSTIPSIMDAVEGYTDGVYDLWTVAEKDFYDGSEEVLKKCNGHGWPLDFLVCGVSYKWCVQRTADALSLLHPVEVALDCTDAGDNEWGGGSRVNVTRRFEEAA